MKNFKSLFLLCSIFLLSHLSHAQIVDKPARFEAGIGMVITQGHTKLRAATGFWITPRLVTHLSVLSPQDKIPCSSPSSPEIVDGRLKELKMRMNLKVGINFRVYQKPKRGFFGGLGITRQNYQILTNSEFKIIDANPYYYYERYRFLEKRTSDNTFGFNSEFGYAYRLKKARFEFLISHNYLFMKGREYEYHTVLESKKTKARSINSDFALSPISFEMSYVIDLF